MDLVRHQRIARFIFWFSQIVAVVNIVALILFIGGNLVGELISHDIDIREDYRVFLYFFCEVLIAVAIRISWRRKRLGPLLMLAFTALICIFWGMVERNVILLHLPLLLSGLLLLLYSYYKEWILKQKP